MVVLTALGYAAATFAGCWLAWWGLEGLVSLLMGWD